MKLHVLSDLHTEFAEFSPPGTDADVVVLAGDIGVGLADIRPLLTPTEFERITEEAMKAAFSSVFTGLVAQLPGNPCARTDEMTERFELNL